MGLLVLKNPEAGRISDPKPFSDSSRYQTIRIRRFLNEKPIGLRFFNNSVFLLVSVDTAALSISQLFAGRSSYFTVLNYNFPYNFNCVSFI